MLFLKKHEFKTIINEIYSMLPFVCITILNYCERIIAKTKACYPKIRNHPINNESHYFKIVQFQIENPCLKSSLNKHIVDKTIMLDTAYWSQLTTHILKHYESLSQQLNTIRVMKLNITKMQYYLFMGGLKRYQRFLSLIGNTKNISHFDGEHHVY